MGTAKFKMGQVVNLGAVPQETEQRGMVFGIMECIDGTFLYYVSAWHDDKGYRHMLNEFEIRPAGEV